MRALGTIVEVVGGAGLSSNDLHTGILDYYDHWSEVDPRLVEHYKYLSRAADIVGNDIVNIATYAHVILQALLPERIVDSSSLVLVSGMTEAFLVSLRSACDAVASALSYRASSRPNQAPSDFRGLVQWAKKNPRRCEPAIAEFLAGDFEWFWNLRSLRDHVVHSGAHATIHTDGRQFNLWVHSPDVGWVTREPLLPLLKRKFEGLVSVSDGAARIINELIRFPSDRLKSRVVCGVFIPDLHQLIRIADDYSAPSP